MNHRRRDAPVSHGPECGDVVNPGLPTRDCAGSRHAVAAVGTERGNAHGCWRSGMLACTLRLGLALALTQFGPEAGARLRPAARILVVSSLGSDATE